MFLFPIPLIFYPQIFKEVFVTQKDFFNGIQQQRFPKPPWPAQEVIFAGSNQFMNAFSFIHIQVMPVDDFSK
jgi:hypothetical protein